MTKKTEDDVMIAEAEARAKAIVDEAIAEAKLKAKEIIDAALQEAESAKPVQKTFSEVQAEIPLVPFRAFKDNGKYRDDIVVIINGVAWTIQRGVEVMIPQNVYEVIRQSEEQKAAANAYREELEQQYQADVKKYFG